MQLLMVCLLVGVTMSALVYASALQQCRQLSKYSSHYGIALPGYSYKSFIANLLVTCYRACQQEPSCQSLNYNLANRICEFNSFAKRPDDLEDKLDNFVYAVNPNRKVEGRSGRTPPPPPSLDWCRSIAGLLPPTMSPVPIDTPGWRQTKWNKGSLSKKTTRRAMLEPRTSRSGVQGVNRYATHASMHIPDRGKPYQRLKRLNSILFLWAYNVSASIVKRNFDAWRKGRIL